MTTNEELFAEFFGTAALEPAPTEEPAGALPGYVGRLGAARPAFADPAAPLVAGCCSCGEGIDRPLNGPRPACTHEGTEYPDGSRVVGGYRVRAAWRGRCFNDRHDVDGVALYSAGNYVPQCGECVAERLGVDVAVVAAPAEHFFKVPRPRRFGGGVFFAAQGNVYELRRADGGGWEAVALSGGLAAPVHGRTQADAIGRVWEMTGAHWDVSQPVIVRREGRDPSGLPQQRRDVLCEGQGLYLVANPKAGGDPWAEPCGRCGGSGELPQYREVNGGVCFGCDGERVLMSYTLEEAAAVVRRRAREARQARDQAALDAERRRRRWERFAGAHPRAAGWVREAAGGGNQFAGEMRARVWAGKELTPAQVEACEEAAEREAEKVRERAAAEALRVERVKRSRPAGAEGETVTVTGTVMRARSYTSGPKWRPVRKRAVVVDDGAGVAVVMFTRSAAAFELSEGDTVTVTGQVKEPDHRDRDTGEVQALITAPKFSGHQPAQTEGAE